MSQPNDVLKDINGKIEREMKLIHGFQALKKNTTNAEVIQRCNTQIRETQLNIDFLQETLRKVTLQQQKRTQNELLTENRVSSTASTDAGGRPVYSRFDLVKYECPSLGHKIQHMLQQLQFKLQVENQYREANEKISHLYLMDGDRSSLNAAEGGRLELDQRIQLLNKALRKYQNMHIDVEDVTRDFEIMSTPKHARKPLNGKLTVGITCIRDVDHVALPMFSKKPELVVVIKVDDVEKARTKGSRTDKWNEEYTFDVDKGHEIEILVFDKSGANMVPVAVNWALLSDITEEIRKRKVANELGSSGWLLANTISEGATGDHTFGGGSTGGSSSGTGSSTAGSGGFLGNDAILGDTSSQMSATGEQKILINTWLSLEPVGQILISLSFEKTNRQGKQFMGGLGRHGAIRQKKEEVFEQHGHQFVQKQFYNIMCCALCGEFLRYTGFQCQDCKFLCHKKCYQKVVTKCISKSSTDIDDAAKLNHRIPHRFEPITNHGTKWCCHCGYILPWGRKNVRKCTECGVMCHAQCTHLVPDFCGMSMEMANKILMTIKSTAKTPVKTSPKQVTPKVRKPQYDLLQQTTPRSHKQQYGDLPPQPLPQEAAKSVPSITISTHSSPTKTSFANEVEEAFETSLPTASTGQPQPEVTYGRRRAPMEERDLPEPVREQEPERKTYEKAYDPQTYEKSYEQQTYERQTYEPQPTQDPRASARDELDYSHVPQHKHKLSYEEQGVAENPFDTAEKSGDVFNNFDYNNNQTQQQIIPNVSEQRMLVHEAKKTSPQKSRRRRRKVGLDDFQFLAVLGKGNFGKVMLAESRHTQNLCAIKVLKKDFIVENDEAESVKSEKRVFLTANKEKHPFLLNLHCCFQTENRIYFVMEYISGGDLMWHIQKSRFLARRAKFYACEVLLGLKYFHDNDIVYRDLKLDNILLTTQGHIKIGDYGLCKENMGFNKTTGTFCGTPEFMAPEIIAGKQYDRSVDWWALGVLLFQMLLCQSPFKGEDEDEIFNAIEHDDVKYPISMPRQTVLVLQALLTKDPTQRLGASERDALEIMEHPYFADVNFDDILACRVQAPYLPEISSEHDYSNFDLEFTLETPRLTPVDTVLTSEMQEQFRGFSHILEYATI